MKYVDLTMLVNSNTPVSPGDLPPVFDKIATIKKDGWNEHRYAANSHFGTHIDFPLHMIENGKSQNDYSMEDFIGIGKLTDVRGKKKIEADLSAVYPGDILLIFTGRSQMNAENYFENNPILTEDFAHRLIQKKVKAVCMDMWSPDAAPYEIHKLLLSHNILLVENLIHLDKLLGKRFKIMIAPIRLDRFDGCPCRIFAEIQE